MLRLLRSSLIHQRNFTVSSLCRTFKSDLSLETLYPNSKQKLYTPDVSQVVQQGDRFNGYIPIDKLTITYSRSSGPGGQNVNKVNTKVDLRFHVKTAEWIPEAVREKIFTEYNNQINKDGFYVIKSDLTRYQHMNLADALERVRNMIRKLEKDNEPKEVSPEQAEVIRKRQEKAARERLFVKRQRSAVKADRRSIE